MLGQWRLTLRKAEHALKAGRLEEATKLVTAQDVRSYRQARDLADRVAEALARRAAGQLEQGDCNRAWADLAEAERLNGGVSAVAELRQGLIRRALEDARRQLEAGQPDMAVRGLERLRRRGGASAEVVKFLDVATMWLAGREFMRIGRFPEAVDKLAQAQSLWSDGAALSKCLEEARAAVSNMAHLEVELHRAVTAEDWERALERADAILAIAPEHAAARSARQRAWQVVGIRVSGIRGEGGLVMVAKRPADPRDGKTIIRPAGLAAEDEADLLADRSDRGGRFLLWVDAVGGYLVCQGDRVSIGQPAGWHVDVPIMADLSRVHAWIERDGEGYFLRAARPAMVGGRPVQDRAVLRDDVQIVLGSGTRLRFRRPNSLSGSARLDLESSHRLALSAESVLLMAETLIIGPKPSCHVFAESWRDELVIYRHGSDLWCRTSGEFEIDGEIVRDRGRLTSSSRVRGEGFSLALEAIGS